MFIFHIYFCLTAVTKDIIHPYVYMDTTLITEIILNIIRNSIKYTAESGKITCTLRQMDESEDGCFIQEFVVRDTGIAMTANAFAEDRNKALSVGMNDHVAKPIDMSKMIPVLLKYI